MINDSVWPNRSCPSLDRLRGFLTVARVRREYQRAYDSLQRMNAQTGNTFEIKAVAGAIIAEICRLLFITQAPLDALSRFRIHLNNYKQLRGREDRLFQHSGWLSDQYVVCTTTDTRDHDASCEYMHLFASWKAYMVCPAAHSLPETGRYRAFARLFEGAVINGLGAIQVWPIQCALVGLSVCCWTTFGCRNCPHVCVYVCVCSQIYCARVQTEHPGFYYRYAATHARERKRLSDALCGGEHATVTQGEAVYVGQPVLIVYGKTLSPEETTLEHICVGSASHSGRYNACLYAQPADHEPVTT